MYIVLHTSCTCVGCMRRLLSSHSGRSRPLVSVKGWWVRLVDERSLTLSSCVGKNTGDDPTSSQAPKVCTPVSEDSSQSSSAGTSVDDIKDAVAEETAAKSKMETIVTGLCVCVYLLTYAFSLAGRIACIGHRPRNAIVSGHPLHFSPGVSHLLCFFFHVSLSGVSWPTSSPLPWGGSM